MRVLPPFSSFLPCDRKIQSQLLFQPTEVELGLQVGVEFDIRVYLYRLGSFITVECSEAIFLLDILNSCVGALKILCDYQTGLGINRTHTKQI